MTRAHRVRTHHWRLGRLEVKDAIFETEAEALAYANDIDGADSVKVFGHDNQLLHNVVSSEFDSYA